MPRPALRPARKPFFFLSLVAALFALAGCSPARDSATGGQPPPERRKRRRGSMSPAPCSPSSGGNWRKNTG
ncbi:MAG: hypothetical protein D9V47_01830 [Clostridia bacterium]|nr:MAG: hypothetical protein D9V47_01830 [Clostridia bacterium]